LEIYDGDVCEVHTLSTVVNHHTWQYWDLIPKKRLESKKFKHT